MGSEYLINILGVASLLVIIALGISLIIKMERIKQLNSVVYNLKRSLDEIDEQAKLIVRTDMELNKAQEELDKKVTGLYALQRLSRSISTTLEEKQIFQRIETSHLEDLGFEKALAFLWNEKEKKYLLRLNIGYSEEAVELIKSLIDSRQELQQIPENEQTLSSISSTLNPASKEELKRAFRVESFVISPILSKEAQKGLLFVGTENTDTVLNEGDEELVTILANQIGQALENSRLFEKTWRAQQELEQKVEERTFALTRALNEVKVISRRKTDFISSVSHELRTPLTSIKGYASILLTGKLGNIPAEVRERLDKINRHSDELAHLVNDLLDIARIESGRMTMKMEPLNLKDAVEEVADLLAVQLKEKNISLISSLDPDAQKVSCDRSQITRVFINLIGNAIKFTPAKGKISVRAHRTDTAVEVDITDNGCGVPADAQTAIFEEFYRVDNPINQEVKGTGLGLALVKHIVEAHQGKIWVSSKVNAGSTFSFTLPLAR